MKMKMQTRQVNKSYLKLKDGSCRNALTIKYRNKNFIQMYAFKDIDF